MEVILTQRCKSLTGELGSGFGYHIQRRKNGFFAKRNSKGVVPPDGHWKFIVSCAELAKNGFMLSDIKVSKIEVLTALRESGRDYYFWTFYHPSYLHATDVLNLKQKLGL